MTNAEIKAISNCKKELNIIINKDDLVPIREEQAREVRKEIQYPGFRKGKAPMGMVKSRYAELINAYTMEAAADKGLRKVLEENQIQVVGQPEAKKLEYNDDGDLVTIIEIETVPEVELKKISGFKLTRDVYKIEDSFVDQTIDRMRREKAEISTVDGPVSEGHIVLIDMQELDEGGVPLVGRNYKDIEVRMGEKRFDEDIEKHLTGMKADEEKQVTKEYPEDYAQKEMAGKKELYKVTVKKVQQEILPELTDEWVEENLGELKTVEELKTSTRQRLEYEYKNQAENRFMEDLTQQILDANPFEIPEVMVENYLDNMVEDAKKRDPKVDEEGLRQYYRPNAERTIKWMYVEQQITKDKNLESTQNDIDKFLGELKDEKIKEFYQSNPGFLDRAKSDITHKKVIDYLTAESKVTDNVIDLK